MSACTSASLQEKETEKGQQITKQQAGPALKQTGDIRSHANAHAEMDNASWMATSFGLNVFNANGKRTYSIYLTDGSSKIIMNYSGPEQKGITNTGETLQASIMDDKNIAYPCKHGLIEFTQFDTVSKHMSGNFKLYCTRANDKTKAMNIPNATFTNLTWK